MAELLFEGHDQFNGVQRVRAQIFNEFSIRRHLVRVDAQLFDDNLFNPLFSCLFSSHEFTPFLFVCLYARSLKRSSVLRANLFFCRFLAMHCQWFG